MSDTEINDRLAQLRKGFQERGFEAFEELCETDPDTYALVLAEAACRLEEEDVDSVEAVQTDGPRPLQVYRKKGESVEKALPRYWTKPELLAADSIQ